ncbi:class I SAM-dependent methyltransferase [Luteimonas sp. MC1782]|uniref:class I SAM-dependent methyltransferase n=1 Tax=Luteimonas sp. MC1782 TaxID=2760305 RepID=UPI0015FFEF92|nr:class I SAM-dependent methyltransferase [Luteimonas sp. MC1782]MBB1472357.1 class I SAM-dependent methyltransferase [Luteimonas sp. MC1782]
MPRANGSHVRAAGMFRYYPAGAIAKGEHMGNEAYLQPRVVEDFATRSALTPAEVAALGEAWPLVRGDVLDVGVGGGRTTGYLHALARSYRALDISPGMVDACRARHPGVDIRLGDARTLEGIDDASCDLVLFSFNGIDYIAYEERAQVHRAVARVLRPGGAFVYSSHNMRILGGAFPPVSLPGVKVTANPLRLAVRIARAVAARRTREANRRRLAGDQVMAQGHAVVNDEAYDHASLTVYVDPAHELEALAAAGFVDVVTIAADGRRDLDVLDDPWIYYVAWKPG